MTDDQARQAQQELHRIRHATRETLDAIEEKAAIEGWLSLVAPIIARRRADLARGHK